MNIMNRACEHYLIQDTHNFIVFRTGICPAPTALLKGCMFYYRGDLVTHPYDMISKWYHAVEVVVLGSTGASFIAETEVVELSFELNCRFPCKDSQVFSITAWQQYRERYFHTVVLICMLGSLLHCKISRSLGTASLVVWIINSL